MPDFREISPSKYLFLELYRQIKPTTSEVRQLIGRPALFTDEHLGGVVRTTRGYHVIVKPEVRSAFNPQRGGFFTQSTAELKFPVTYIEPKPSVVAWVHTRLPDRISVHAIEPNGQRTSLAEVSFGAEDPELDKVLREGLFWFPRVRTAEDIKYLTAWVHHQIPYGLSPDQADLADTQKTPLGTILAARQALCRHQAAVEFAILALQGIPSRIVFGYNLSYYIGQNKKRAEGHMYLEIPFADSPKPYIANPTAGTFGTKTQIIAALTHDPLYFERSYPTEFVPHFLN